MFLAKSTSLLYILTLLNQLTLILYFDTFNNNITMHIQKLEQQLSSLNA